ncbi:MAG: hypothetical protein KME05_16370 [Gloeocapsa sp. UFS-A4-WI-NPMV-4B04]|jgi:hypothetical protein|nr:hypothetical protein [Gloeocapsa sp. UFS-A4-WI-NPMV-4B04]
MTYDIGFELDQQRCEQQATIAEELFISGQGDGFDGNYPASSEIDYLAGYSQGLRRRLADIQGQALLLQQEGLVVEAMFGDELVF